jgi:cation diffusion facilitator family transporter
VRPGPGVLRFALVALAAALAVVAMKFAAYGVTGSVAILSDALESTVNVVAAVAAVLVLRIADRPPDEEHAYGHGKVEYFSGGFEGALIVVAALVIALTAGSRLLDPRPVVRADIGLAVLVVASLLNWGVATMLFRSAATGRSIALEAHARHLMADVWTTVGVVVGVGLAVVTGAHWLDPLVALLVAAHIVVSGVRLIRRSALGLIDTALPEEDRGRVEEVLDCFRATGVAFHALRTRRSGFRRFVSVHVLVPGDWSVQRGHELAEEIEEALRSSLPGSSIFTHLEPIDDPVSWADTSIERRLPS